MLLGLFAAAPVQAAGDRADLFPGSYVSTAVLKSGAPHPLFEETKIRVNFRHGGESDSVSWRADCNYFGADVEVTDERLFTSQIVQTDMGCPDAPLRRDRWMARFFRADPKWRIPRDERLKLTAGDRVIRLTSRQPDK